MALKFLGLVEFSVFRVNKLLKLAQTIRILQFLKESTPNIKAIFVTKWNKNS